MPWRGFCLCLNSRTGRASRSAKMVQGSRQGGPPHRLLTVRVKRCVEHPQRFRDSVLEKNGALAETSSRSFASEAEAIRAGNAAARAIRRQDYPSGGI